MLEDGPLGVGPQPLSHNGVVCHLTAIQPSHGPPLLPFPYGPFRAKCSLNGCEEEWWPERYEIFTKTQTPESLLPRQEQCSSRTQPLPAYLRYFWHLFSDSHLTAPWADILQKVGPSLPGVGWSPFPSLCVGFSIELCPMCCTCGWSGSPRGPPCQPHHFPALLRGTINTVVCKYCSQCLHCYSRHLHQADAIVCAGEDKLHVECQKGGFCAGHLI